MKFYFCDKNFYCLLTCLLEFIAGDDDVTPMPTGRLLSVGPPVTE